MPRGRPSGNGTQRARGGLTTSVCSRIRLIPVVAMPSSSRKCARVPTVPVQAGQTGVSIAQCTPESWRRCARSAAASFINAGLGFEPRTE